MAKTSENSKNTKKKTAAGTRKTAAPRKTKPEKAEKKQTKTSASAGWREKKADIQKNNRMPKTLAERKKVQERGAFLQFFANHSGIFDMIAVPFALFALLCIISLATGNEREAAVWAVDMSRKIFGGICFLLYLWIIVFCARFWLRNTRFERLRKVPYRRYLYFLGLYFFLTLILQYTAGKQIPPLPPEQAGGLIAETVISMVRNILGNSGVVILIISLFIFFIWQAWKYLAAVDKAQKNKENVVPVRLYWEDVHTAAEAEALEAEKQKAELTSDIEEDFRSSMGQIPPREEEQPQVSLREEAGSTLRKLRETFREIAQPIPDRDAMVPAERPVKEESTAEPVVPPAPKKKTGEKAPRKTGSKSSAPSARQLPLTAEIPEEPNEPEPIPEPSFEENDDHRGSGLLSAPAKPKPVRKEKPKEEIHIRTHTVKLDEENETVITAHHDVSFVPTVAPSEEDHSETEKNNSDPWILPKVSEILDPVKKSQKVSEEDEADTQKKAQIIEEVLRKHEANSTVVDIQHGPTFTQFGVEPGFIEKGGRKTRVRISKIEGLKKDLEMALAVEKLSIEAPLPGKNFIGVQVQNKEREKVLLREVIESENLRDKKRHLGVAIGKDVNGATFSADLTRMPHLLIAGTTGSGKSVCLNSILMSLLLFNSPERLKLVLVDPKLVEFSNYNGIPHLITPPVVDMEQVGNVLQWALREMDMRNLHFMENGVRNIQEYNEKFVNKPLPYIVIVVDELANLMMEASSEIENYIVRLAQMGRAMGIHLIVATQRPDSSVVTGTIKANLPTRIALSVSSHIDSQTIIDRKGAEDLFGNGDMYYISPENTDMKRLQGVFISNTEKSRLIQYWRNAPRTDVPQETQDPDLVKVPQPVTQTVMRQPDNFSGTLTQLPLFNEPAPPLKKGDPLYDDAVRLVQREGRVTQNMLVSKLGIGFGRANKLIARMEEEGIVSPEPPIGGRREVLDFGEYGPANDGEKD